jgi:hypothetical protein
VSSQLFELWRPLQSRHGGAALFAFVINKRFEPLQHICVMSANEGISEAIRYTEVDPTARSQPWSRWVCLICLRKV